MDGKWVKQAAIAEQTIRINKLLHATDVSVQRQSKACLGTASNLLIDAVRLVLTGSYETGQEYLRAVRELSGAAVADGEMWVFTDAAFARGEALRLRAVASWALQAEDSDADAAAALKAWAELAETEAVVEPSDRNAHTIVALLAAHSGDFERASVSIASIPVCDERSSWCVLTMLIRRLGSRALGPVQWDEFFADRVVTASADRLVAAEFNVGEACMIASIRSRLHGWEMQPFQIIELLRG